MCGGPRTACLTCRLSAPGALAENWPRPGPFALAKDVWSDDTHPFKAAWLAGRAPAARAMMCEMCVKCDECDV